MMKLDLLNGVKEVKLSSNKSIESRLANEESILRWQELLAVYSDLPNVVRIAENYKEVSEAYPIIECILGKRAEDTFYSYKLGYRIKGVKSKYVFLLQKALGKFPPNAALTRINSTDLKSIALITYQEEDGSLLKLINTITNKNNSIIDKDNLVTVNEGVYEAYIESIDEVCILPRTMGEHLLRKRGDVKLLTYDEVEGVMFDGISVQSLVGKYNTNDPLNWGNVD